MLALFGADGSVSARFPNSDVEDLSIIGLSGLVDLVILSEQTSPQQSIRIELTNAMSSELNSTDRIFEPVESDLVFCGLLGIHQIKLFCSLNNIMT
jgi:hypothetical protein